MAKLSFADFESEVIISFFREKSICLRTAKNSGRHFAFAAVFD